MKNPTHSTLLALALMAGMAMPAAAAPQGPPSVFMSTEQAYTMTPLAAYASGGTGGLTIRNGMPGNWEWWLMGTTLGITPAFGLGTWLGGKYNFMQTGGGMAGAVHASINPSLNAGAFGLGANAGLAFSQSLVFGNVTFNPNVALGNITPGPMGTMVNLNVGLVAPMMGGWHLLLEDVPTYAVAGGAFTNKLAVGGRFVPAPNTALDLTVGTLTGSTFNAGILGVNGWVGW
jgi:hypothetical protein